MVLPGTMNGVTCFESRVMKELLTFSIREPRAWRTASHTVPAWVMLLTLQEAVA